MKNTYKDAGKQTHQLVLGGMILDSTRRFVVQAKPYIFGMPEGTMHPFLGNLLWFMHGFTCRLYFIITPLLVIFSILQRSEDFDRQFVSSIAVQTVIIVIGLVLNFSTFTRPNQKYLHPGKNVRFSMLETYRMLLNYYAATCAVNILAILGGRLFDQFIDIDLWYISFLLVITIIWIIERIVDIIHRRKAASVSLLQDLDLSGKAARKLKNKLTLQEQEELTTLIFQEHKSKTTNISALGRIVALSVLFALVVQLLQVFLGDYVRAILG